MCKPADFVVTPHFTSLSLLPFPSFLSQERGPSQSRRRHRSSPRRIFCSPPHPEGRSSSLLQLPKSPFLLPRRQIRPPPPLPPSPPPPLPPPNHPPRALHGHRGLHHLHPRTRRRRPHAPPPPPPLPSLLRLRAPPRHIRRRCLPPPRCPPFWWGARRARREGGREGGRSIIPAIPLLLRMVVGACHSGLAPALPHSAPPRQGPLF